MSLLAALLLASACGVATPVGGALPGAVVVSVQPPSATLALGATQQFAAAVDGGAVPGVTWSVLEPDGGSVDASGGYRAPAVAGTYHVVATSVADPSAQASAQVAVSGSAPALSVRITPASPTLAAGGTLQFSATVSGSSTQAVTWSVVEPGGGAITAGGLYTPPGVAGHFTIKGLAQADGLTFGTTSVGVTVTTSGAGTTVAAGDVSGHWTLAGSPYRITGDIRIPNGSTLTIDPGVKVEFQGPFKLQCYGGLHAVGTPTQRIRFTTTDADVAKGAWAWTGWRGLRISGSHTYQARDGLHDFGAGLFDIQWTEIAYVDKAQGGAYTNYDPHEEWNGSFYASDIIPGDLIFNDNWVHHAKASTSTGGGQLFWISHLGGGYVPNSVPDYYFYRNVFEDSQWGGAYFAHNSRADGSLVVGHLVGGAFRRTQRQALGSSSVCSVFSTSASLDGVEITDCGDQASTPWFKVVATPGTITYTAPSAASISVAVSPPTTALAPGATQQFTATVTGATDPSVTWSVLESGGGTITGGGLYTAPATAGTYTVSAVSNGDGSTSATATVVVTATGGGSGKFVTGYWAAWTAGNMVAYPHDKIDWTALTHLAVAFANLSGNTLVYQGGNLNSALARQVTAAAHANGRKAILMIGGVGSASLFATATGNTPATALVFAQNIVTLAQADGFDGVDLDWEGIWSGANGAPGDQVRMKNLALALRGLWPGMVLTVAMGWDQTGQAFWSGMKDGSGAWLFDQFNVMTYDAANTWQGWVSWFHSALDDAATNRPSSVANALAKLSALGVPRDRIGMGIPFYGSAWTKAAGAGVYGPRQTPATSNGNGASQGQDSTWTYKYILDNYAWTYTGADPILAGTGGRTMPDGASTGTIHEAAAGATYFTGGAAGSSRNGQPAVCFLSYDDPTSIAAKGSWIKANGYGGTIIWLINEGAVDTAGTNPLLAAVKAAFLQ
jgi:GH18 family chitinase